MARGEKYDPKHKKCEFFRTPACEFLIQERGLGRVGAVRESPRKKGESIAFALSKRIVV
jgi:hypothetical protein